MYICDFHITYASCSANTKSLLAGVDLASIIGYGLTAVPYLWYVGKHLYKRYKHEKRLAIEGTPIIHAMYVMFVAISLKMVFYCLTRTTAVSDWNLTTTQQIIFLKLVICILEGLSFGMFTISAIIGLTLEPLYTPITLRGTKVYNPGNLLKVIRLISPTLLIICYCFFGTVGLQDSFNYIFYRRWAFLVYVFTCALLIVPLISFFGYRRLKKVYNDSIQGNKHKKVYVVGLYTLLKNSLALVLLGYSLSALHFLCLVLVFQYWTDEATLVYAKIVVEMLLWFVYVIPIFLVNHIDGSIEKQKKTLDSKDHDDAVCSAFPN
ncbi:hypothetical protein HDU91_003611 [Kappamyces sp. JEL0680]|nr:hypothetical protein HDU91_003611 [Kappamyces sp. JEL0680]